MPIGNSSIEPKDRPVIIVGSKESLHQLALKLGTKNLAISIINPLRPFFDFKHHSILFNIIQGITASNSEEQLLSMLGVLEKVLDIKYKIYWYDYPDAVRLFTFDVGHTPRECEILLQHPINQDRYIVAPTYSHRISREKEAAFRQLAAALGAKELRLISAEIKEKRGFLSSAISFQQAAAQVGISVDFDQSGNLVKKVYSRFGKPDFPPNIPTDLQCWVDSDPDLKTMAYGRVNANLEYDRVSLEFRESMGIGGEIAAKVWSRGLDLDGKYEQIFHSVWQYEIEYWSK